MPAPLVQRLVMTACVRHGLGPVEALRPLLTDIAWVTTPVDLRRVLSQVRGVPRPLAEQLLWLMPRSGAEFVDAWAVWFHAGDGRWGRDWWVTERGAGDDASVLELQQLSAACVQDEDAERRFLDEHARLRDLRHPLVAGCRAWGILTGRRPYRLIDVVEGSTLERQRERRGRLTLSELLAQASSLSQAVAAIHDVGLLHRDLASEAVLVRPNGGILLLDVARAGDRPLTIPPEVVPLTPRMGQDWADAPPQRDGTRRWRKVDRTRLELWTQPPREPAPEVARGARPDAATDVYDFGRILAQMLSDIAPGSTPDHGVQRLVQACLDQDPARRPTALACAAYLEGLQETLLRPTGRVARPLG